MSMNTNKEGTKVIMLFLVISTINYVLAVNDTSVRANELFCKRSHA